jgi:hypothetical protein
VKVINYVLVNPDRKYSKKQIALGAGISRVTLDSFINNLEEMNILLKDKTTYTVNMDSKIVQTLIKTQMLLANISIEEGLENYDETIDALNDEEFELFMDSIDYEIDINKEIEKLERNEISIANNENAFVISSHEDSTSMTMSEYFSDSNNRRNIKWII